MVDIVLTVLISLGFGGVIGWWLTQRFALDIVHRHRVIEEHVKKLHEYAEQYYLKIIGNVEFLEGRLRRILEKLDASSVATEEELELSLFALARLTKLEEEWFREKSATLLLKDRTAEKVIAWLQGKVEDRFFGESGYLSRQDDAKIRDAISSAERLSGFKDKIRQGELKRILDTYKASVQNDVLSLKSLVDCLYCLHTLFYFEVNTCYDVWYGKKTTKPSFQEQEWRILEETLRELEEKGKIGSKEKQQYVKKILGKKIFT